MHKKEAQGRFSAGSRLRSFRFAITGLRTLFQGEPNALIHLLILAAVIIAGISLEISKYDWIAIAVVSSMVFASELFNSSVERLADIVDPERNEKIKQVKDLAAGGVLVSAAGAAFTGLFIFIPEIVKLLR